MKCLGRNAISGELIEVSAERAITGVDPLLRPPSSEDPWLAPGFVDIQVNGFAGVDYCSPTAPHAAIERSLQVQFSAGVTRLFPTVITGSPDDMLGALRNLARAKQSVPYGEAMEGFHVEGPHISPEDGPRGAHPRQWVRPPDFEEFVRWQDATDRQVKLVTVSPEWPGMPDYVERVTEQGVVVSIGHTKAEASQIQDCVKAGATLSTHIGNGAHGVMQRHPNYIWEQLAEDRLAASMIVDGIHLGPAFLKVALRAKGIERSVLITDAVMPAECPVGVYKLGEVDVERKEDGRVVLLGGTRLAGSTLRMDRGIENLMRIGGLSLREAIIMATSNAARVGRVAGRMRGLQPGERGDVAVFEYHARELKIRVLETHLSGELVYRA